MQRYSIGRIQLPWLNLTPPIRGGVFGKADPAPDAELIHAVDAPQPTGACDLDLDLGRAGDTAATGLERHSAARAYRRYTSEEAGNSTSSETSSLIGDSLSPVDSHQTQSSAEDYISSAVQGEIDSDLKDFPSLDARTQQNLNSKYQALHRRVGREGFYDCHYSEYAKEGIRYALLFAAFAVALRSGWYLTSAAFLGLFWVWCFLHSPVSH